MTRYVPLLLLAVLLGDPAPAPAMGGKKKEKYSISFHTQGSDMDSPRSIFPYPVPGRETPMLFAKVPEFSHANIAAIQPFPAETGNGFGMSLKLDFRGSNALELISRTRSGEFLLPVVNGVPNNLLRLERPVVDGIVTVWEGIPEATVLEMQKKFPLIKELKTDPKNLDMLPTTRAEKRRAINDAEDDRRQIEKDAKKALREGTEAPAPSIADPEPPLPLPTAPTSSQIPLESGAAAEPPLPRQ